MFLVCLMILIFHYLSQQRKYYPKAGEILMKLGCNWILNSNSLEGGPHNISVAPTMVVYKSGFPSLLEFSAEFNQKPYKS